MQEIDTVKGFQDFLHIESLKRDAIKKVIEKKFRLYGFSPIETPIIEYEELMKKPQEQKEQEDEAVSDRFRLKDRGGRDLGLRYEFTFQLARIIKQNPNLRFPFRRYQIGEVFRDEPVGKNRFRQFTQCDADIIGDTTIHADAEILALFSDILKDLKIKNEIRVNNRKLINSLIESVEISFINETLKEIDKIDKVGVDQAKSNLRKYASPNQIVTLFKLLEKDLAFFKENAFPGVEELEQLIKGCKTYNLKINFSPFLVRGLSYYTGNIFEIIESDSFPSHTIAGGGRYDKTVGKYLPREVPAVGCSFGLERLTSIAKIEIEQIPKALIISLEQDRESIKLAKLLREKNISCYIDFGKLSRALEYANALAIPYVILAGKQEIEKNKFKLKDMKSGEEKLLTDAQIIRKLKKY